MKLIYIEFQLLFVVYAFACKSNQIPYKRPECEINKQDKNKFGCTESLKFCKACCLYDLLEMNEDKNNEHFYVKEIISNVASRDCTCKFCRRNI